MDKVLACGYTQQQLEEAWQLVAPAEHWKAPIDAYIDPAAEAVVREAIIHFTATVPTFNKVKAHWVAGPNREAMKKLYPTVLHVKAAGYWAGPAGP